MTPAAILDRLMQGTARQKLGLEGPLAAGIAADDASASLKLLALAAQAMRFAPPRPPASFDEHATHPDSRAVVPDAARPLMLRLIAGKGNPPDDPAAFALAVALDRLKLRPHPFDLPRMEAFLRKHTERLGPAALAFTSRDSAREAASWFDAEELDASNWMQATPARKAGFIAGLRAEDPAGARALVEAQLPLEKADVRVRLVDALATGLGADDRALLETLTRDRAPNVKQAATRLLARLPGTDAAQAQLGELCSRISASKAGLLRKRTTLKLQLPANLRGGPAINAWLVANFGAVGSDQLAAALDLTPEELLDAARDDAALIQGIAFAACAGRDWLLLRRIVDECAPGLWNDFLLPGLDAFGIVTARERVQWANAVLPRSMEAGAAHPWSLAALQNLFEGPLPLAQARMIFAAALSAPSAPEALTAATAVLPLEAMAEARRALAAQPPDIAGRAQLLAELLHSLHEGRSPP